MGTVLRSADGNGVRVRSNKLIEGMMSRHGSPRWSCGRLKDGIVATIRQLLRQYGLNLSWPGNINTFLRRLFNATTGQEIDTMDYSAI